MGTFSPSRRAPAALCARAGDAPFGQVQIAHRYTQLVRDYPQHMQVREVVAAEHIAFTPVEPARRQNFTGSHVAHVHKIDSALRKGEQVTLPGADDQLAGDLALVGRPDDGSRQQADAFHSAFLGRAPQRFFGHNF